MSHHPRVAIQLAPGPVARVSVDRRERRKDRQSTTVQRRMIGLL